MIVLAQLRMQLVADARCACMLLRDREFEFMIKAIILR